MTEGIIQFSPDQAIDLNPASQTFGWRLWKHPDGQWVTDGKPEEFDLSVIAAKDMERGVEREFAVASIHSWTPVRAVQAKETT